MRRTSYAGETSTANLHPSNFGPSSTSEPKLYRKGTIGRAGARSKVHQQDGDEANDKNSEEPNRKLQRMKAQSKKTFKFRKTRRREANDPSGFYSRWQYKGANIIIQEKDVMVSLT